jgi:hypothetical protein
MAAKYNLDHGMKLLNLYPMARLRLELDHDWSIKPGAYGRGLKQQTSPALWARLESTYAGAGLEDNWDALLRTMSGKTNLERRTIRRTLLLFFRLRQSGGPYIPVCPVTPEQLPRCRKRPQGATTILLMTRLAIAIGLGIRSRTTGSSNTHECVCSILFMKDLVVENDTEK